jgi:predicted RND superfamily exporter protein
VSEAPEGRHHWIARLTAFTTGRARLVAAGAVIVAAVCIWLTFQLHIDQQLRALLPEWFPSVSRLLEMEARQGNQSDLYVVIRSPSRDENIRFGAAVAEALQARDDLRFVVFHREYDFFEERALLFMEIDELEHLRERVKSRIQAEVSGELLGEFDDGGEAEGGAEPLPDEDSLKEEYGLDDTLSEYFEADEGRLIVVKARPVKSNTDVEFSRTLNRDVTALIAGLDPASYHPEMEVEIEGSFAENARRVGSMESNVITGSAVTLGLLFLSLVVFFRRFGVVVLIFVPLLLSTFAALAAGRLVFQELNLISAFIFAVLLGLGIDFSIHFVSRYRSERSNGLSLPDAVTKTLATTGLATFAGAASTTAGFLVLVGSDFQGFVQFGVVGSIGVMLAIVGVFLVMPAVLALVTRDHGPLAAPEPAAADKARARLEVPKHRIPSWIPPLLALLGLAGGVAGVVLAPDLTFETNLNNLGMIREEVEVDETRISYRDAVGKATTTAPAVILTENLDETRRVHRILDHVVKLAEAEEAAADAEAAAESGAETASGPVAPPTVAPGGGVDPDEDFGGGADPDEDFGGGVDPDEDFGSGDPTEDFGAGGDPDEDFGAGGDPDEDFGDDPAEDFGAGASPAEAPIPPPEPLPLPDNPAHLQVMKDRLARVFSIFAFVPERQEEKLRIIADIKRRIDRKRGALTAETQAKVDKWYHYLEVKETFGVDALPGWVTAQFVDLEGEVGRFVIFWTKGPKADYRNSKQIYDHFFDLDIGNGEMAHAGASYFVLPEIIDTIIKEGPILLALVGLCMLIAAAFLLRRAAAVVAVAVTVVLPILWLLVIMRFAGWSFNFYNVIAFSLLIGIGQDDALHIYHRYLEEGPGNIRRVLLETGGAIFMTSWTTILGFASLLFSGHRGLITLAEVTITGLALCFLSSVVVLPAILGTAERLQGRSAQ